MLLNDSYNHAEVNRQINESVGKAYGFFERIKMKGNGSPRLLIAESSKSIQELLDLDNNASWCYIEIRPKGIVLRFRSLLETFAFVIPWWKLTVFKTDAQLYTLHQDGEFVRLNIVSTAEQKFIKRLMETKLEQFGSMA
jgi:hypothetical protein